LSLSLPPSKSSILLRTHMLLVNTPRENVPTPQT
jgi:hypothetical protein